jgi:non-heme chloroperoxidase
MGYFNVGTENSTTIDLYYEDHGTGRPVVLIHGFPLSGASWEKQVPGLLASGHRVIAYDRRGFGRSSQPTVGYDYDTFAADLNALMTTLDLNDVTLVGFSMGGGEVARYLGKYGPGRVRNAIFIGAVPPYLLKADDNPDGVPGEVFEGIKAAIAKDRPSFLTGFFANFFNVDELKGTRITDEAIQMSWNVAIAASPVATLACVDTWGTDFRADIEKIDVPTLVIHGDADRIVPIAVAGARTASTIPGARLVAVAGGPHAVNWTHPDEVNAAILEFLA